MCHSTAAHSQDILSESLSILGHELLAINQSLMLRYLRSLGNLVTFDFANQEYIQFILTILNLICDLQLMEMMLLNLEIK